MRFRRTGVPVNHSVKQQTGAEGIVFYAQAKFLKTDVNCNEAGEARIYPSAFLQVVKKLCRGAGQGANELL